MAFNRNIHINVTSSTQGLQSGMNQAVSSVSQATNSMKVFGGAANSLASGPLQNFQSNLQTLPKQMDSVGKATDSSGGKLRKFGEAFKGNRGLVFGVAGLSSAMAEMVGMFGMYGDAAKMVADDQDKLNKLTKAGLEGTHEFTQTQQELLKHTRFLNMAQRNTALSMMDNVFFLTMAANGMLELAGKGTKLTGVFGKLKGSITGLSTVSKGYSTLIAGSSGLVAGTTALELIMGKTGRTVDGTTKSVNTLRASVLAALGPITALVAAITLALAGVATVQAMSADTMNNHPEMFNKDKEGNVDKNFFGSNSLLGRTFSGQSLPGEKAPIKGEQEAFEKSPVGVFLNSIPGYKQIGKIIGDLANQSFPELSKAQGDAAGEAVKAKTNEELFSGALKQSQSDIFHSTALINTFTKGVADQNLTKEQAASTIDGYIEGLKGEQEALLRTDATSGALSITKDKLTEMYGNATKASGDYTLFIENEKAVLADKLRIDTEYAAMEAEIAKQHSANAVAIAEAEQEARDYAEAVGENVIMGKLDYDMAMKVREVHLSVRDAYKEEELGLMKLAEENGIMIDNLNEKTQNTKDDTVAMMDQINAELKWTAALEDTQRAVEMTSKGHLQGSLDLQQFADSITYTNAHSETYRQGLEDLMKTKFGIIDTTHMLTNEMEFFVSNGLMNTEDHVIALTRMMSEFQDSAREAMSSLLDADNAKDFNKAWKELDLGAVPKKLRDDLKDVWKELRVGAENGKEVATALNLVEGAMGKLSEKKVDKILKKTFDEMKKMGDPELRIAMAQYPSMFNDIEKNAKRLPLTFGKLTEVMADGNLTWDEFNELLGLYKQESQGATEDTIKLGDSVQKIDPKDKVARQINQIAINLNDQTKKTNILKAKTDALIGGIQLHVRAMNQQARVIVQIIKNLNTLARATDQNTKNVKSLSSAIGQLKSKTVTLTVKTRITGPGSGSGNSSAIFAKALAEGGIISAAHGFTTSGPQLLLVGDNPSGKETIAAIPHDSPRRTMDELNRKFGSGETSGTQTIILNPTIIIGQDKLSFTQRYRVQQGESVANQV